jgi:photosystem II stability/assembly factor-like uncharacterized protein
MAPPASAWIGPRLLVGLGLGGRRATSRDGMAFMNDTQDERATGESAKSFFDAAYGREILVAVGGGCPGGACAVRVTTFNGERWSDRSVPPEAVGPMTGIAYGKGAFVAVGPSGTVMTSPDGRSWTVLRMLGSTLRGARKIAFGSVGGVEMFVVVGDNGLRARSLDGQSFSTPHRGFPGADGEIALLAVEIGNGYAIAAGAQGRRIRSRDGLDWTDPAAGGGTLSSLVFAEGKFMAYGDASVAHVTGDNGLTWTAQTLISPPNAAVESGVMGPARLYVGFSSAGATIKTSPNGIAWTTQARSNPDMNALTRFAFAGP